MPKIKRALISVSDKTGVIDLARELNSFGVEIISTGGTAKLLKENKIPVKDISEYTGFPEMLNGRVKTLHPKVHAGLLALRENREHMEAIKKNNFELIDMVVVNLYPFAQTVCRPGVGIEEVIENIDIGGPSMLRSAAKNYRSVAVVCEPGSYPEVIKELRENNGALPEGFLRKLGVEVFKHTSSYDAQIYDYLSRQFNAQVDSVQFPDNLSLYFEKIQDLRYGENPHQKASLYREKGKSGQLVDLKQLQGKELSFNNILDLNAAVELIKEFVPKAAAVIVKHNNPCGVAQGPNLSKAYSDAWSCDKLSAFGGIVALSKKLDIDTARIILKSGFLECIVAPEYDKKALGLFKDKKNLRILELNNLNVINEVDFKRIGQGLLLQDKDLAGLNPKCLRSVTKKTPTKSQIDSLIFGWKVAKHVKSNAIVLTKGTRTVGIGAGQMSRVESVIIAIRKAGKNSRNSCLASDAFFPKPDSIVCCAKAGIKSIIQPGGSIADNEIIKACDRSGISMVTTGIRHFKH